MMRGGGLRCWVWETLRRSVVARKQCTQGIIEQCLVCARHKVILGWFDQLSEPMVFPFRSLHFYLSIGLDLWVSLVFVMELAFADEPGPSMYLLAKRKSVSIGEIEKEYREAQQTQSRRHGQHVSWVIHVCTPFFDNDPCKKQEVRNVNSPICSL